MILNPFFAGSDASVLEHAWKSHSNTALVEEGAKTQGESKLDWKPPIPWWAKTSSVLDVCYVGLESEGSQIYNGLFLNDCRIGADSAHSESKCSHSVLSLPGSEWLRWEHEQRGCIRAGEVPPSLYSPAQEASITRRREPRSANPKCTLVRITVIVVSHRDF